MTRVPSWRRRTLSLTEGMKRFFIITNEMRDKELSVTHMIEDYIASKGGECSYYISRKAEWNSRSLRKLNADVMDADCILVLGGDGTLVRAARELAKTGIPLIGVNLGTIGYLCELDIDNVCSAIDLLMEDRYEVESRMLIEGSAAGSEGGCCTDPAVDGCAVPVSGETGDGERFGSAEPSIALNDIVIHRSGNAQLINLDLTVNGEYLATYSADGMILATPTGSTGYSMSAGGPIVDPKTELLLITPINPHALSARSIVVGADALIEVTLAERRAEKDEEAEVAFDGDHFIHMKVGDSIRVKRADVRAHIMRLDRLSFLQILRKKMS